MSDTTVTGASIPDDILAEMARQTQRHPIRPDTCLHWCSVTTEELAEAASEITSIILELNRRSQDVAESLDCRDREEAVKRLRVELVQSAACLHSWIGWIDRRYGISTPPHLNPAIDVPIGLTCVDGDDEP